MYNSTNLPLEKRKIIKKSCGGCCPLLIFAIVFSLIALAFQSDYPGLNFLQFVIWGGYFLIIFGNILYQYFYYKFYFYNFGDDSAEIKKGVVAQATGHVYYSRIQNIYVDQDILDRIFQLYDVHYETAGESSAFYSHVDGLNKINADKLIEFILAKAKNSPAGQTPQTISQTVPGAGTLAAPIAPPPNMSLTVELDRAKLPLANNYAFVMSFQTTLSFMFLIVFIFIGITVMDFALGITILLIALVIIFLISYLYSYYWLKNLDFTFDQEKGMLTTGVLSREKKIVYYNRIQNININQSFLERLFGLNRVGIETAGESVIISNRSMIPNMFSIPGLRQTEAENLRNFLLEHSKISRANI